LWGVLGADLRLPGLLCLKRALWPVNTQAVDKTQFQPSPLVHNGEEKVKRLWAR
jgi:hypothetical protein